MLFRVRGRCHLDVRPSFTREGVLWGAQYEEIFRREVVSWSSKYDLHEKETGELFFLLSFPFLPHFHFSYSFSQTFTCSSDICLCASFVSCVVIFYISIFFMVSFLGRDIFEIAAFFKISSKFSSLNVSSEQEERLFFSIFLLVKLLFIYFY